MRANDRYTLAAAAPTTLILLLALLLLLAGCGGAGASSGAQPPATVTGGATATPTVGGVSATTTGCPQATQIVQWPSPPTVIVTTAQTAKGATVQVGQSLEVALPFGHKWTLGLDAGQPALALSTPAGYGDASLQSCIWRFTTKQAGQVTLTFSSAPICQPHRDCSQAIGLLRIPITVTTASS